MRTVRGKTGDDTVIDDASRLDGLILGSTEVSRNTTLSANSEIIGDLSIGKDARVDLYGTVNGNVINEGGHLKVYGIVGGKITRKGGNTAIDPSAIVLGDID